MNFLYNKKPCGQDAHSRILNFVGIADRARRESFASETFSWHEPNGI